MKKTIFISSILATLLLTTTNPVSAADAKFKVVVVKGAVGSVDITKGELASGIEKLTTNKSDQDFYASKMSLCVAYLQARYNDKSESTCTAAINSLESLPHANSKVRYLTALNYSNRGVARYRKNQLTAALEDFQTAVAIDQNPITNDNLASMRKLLPTAKVETVTELAD